MLPINASKIQGSALGPVEYVFVASDLHPSSPANRICKYADDTYLLVPASNSNSIPQEIQQKYSSQTMGNCQQFETQQQQVTRNDCSSSTKK